MVDAAGPNYPLYQAKLAQRLTRGEILRPDELRQIQHPTLRQVHDIALTANGNAKEALLDANDRAIDAFLGWLATQPKGKDGLVDDSLGLHPITLAELLARDFPPMKWLVEEMIALGHLAMLAGRPKSGKSWLVLQLAQCLDLGLPFLEQTTRPAKVLLIALEDGERRVSQRCKLLKWQPKQVHVAFHLKKLDDRKGGLGKGIEQLRAAAEKYDLIILDTLIKSLTGQVKENDNTQMGEIVNTLADIAHQSETAIILIHHTGKGIADSVFDTLRGASALRGAYDVGMILERKQGEMEAILHGEGRDVDFRPITIRQAVNGAGWNFLGNSKEIFKIRAGRKVVEAMLEHDPDNQGMTAEGIAQVRGVSVSAIRQQLNRAEGLGYVFRETQVVQAELLPDGTTQKEFAKPSDLWFVAEAYR